MNSPEPETAERAYPEFKMSGKEPMPVDRRVLRLSIMAVLLGVAAAIVSRALQALIGMITGIAFFGTPSWSLVSPAGNNLGWWVVPIPVIGGIIVGLMARYGSAAIRGHGIPEAMEQILRNESRIAPRVTVLKPLGSAVAIGTGGPFGAEGPIIATGAAMGSVVGQVLRTTATERKILLAAGAAAGMSAIFGAPLSAVILAVELLLFEFRPSSLVPVALASVTADVMRRATIGTGPIFAMSSVPQPGTEAMIFYVLLGAVMGLISVGVIKALTAIEVGYEKLPIHWMWWPALSGIVIGVVGVLVPHTLGVGYENIHAAVTGSLVGWAALILAIAKLVSWTISLGSGTSGGTLAPLFTIGGGLGAALGSGLLVIWPTSGIDVRIAGLVGMAALFAGSTRAVLTAIVFAFETTLEPAGILPLLGGCMAAYMISGYFARFTIMTEGIARKKIRVSTDYVADALEQLSVSQVASHDVVTLDADRRIADVRMWLDSGAPGSQHQGFPVVEANGRPIGVVTRRNLANPELRLGSMIREAVTRPPIVIKSDRSARAAADHMVRSGVGRLLVISGGAQPVLEGIITRSDLLAAHRSRLDAASESERTIAIPRPRWPAWGGGPRPDR